jgi:hypothetical protein
MNQSAAGGGGGGAAAGGAAAGGAAAGAAAAQNPCNILTYSELVSLPVEYGASEECSRVTRVIKDPRVVSCVNRVIQQALSQIERKYIGIRSIHNAPNANITTMRYPYAPATEVPFSLGRRVTYDELEVGKIYWTWTAYERDDTHMKGFFGRVRVLEKEMFIPKHFKMGPDGTLVEVVESPFPTVRVRTISPWGEVNRSRHPDDGDLFFEVRHFPSEAEKTRRNRSSTAVTMAGVKGLPLNILSHIANYTHGAKGLVERVAALEGTLERGVNNISNNNNNNWAGGKRRRATKKVRKSRRRINN